MSADITVQPATDADRYLASDQLTWPEENLPGPPDDVLEGLAPQNRFAAEVPGADPASYAGIYGVFGLTLSVPGRAIPGRTGEANVRQVPCSGLTWVGVHPDQRRRGILTAMLRDHFERVRDEDGTHVSALHASEQQIYGRHGYGLASLEQIVTLGRGTTFVAPGLDEATGALETRLATAGDPGMPERMRACALTGAATTLGEVVLDAGYYTRLCRRRPEWERDKEPVRVLFAMRDGGDVGYAMVRRELKFERGRPDGVVQVGKMFGDPAARLALLRRLVDMDLTGSARLHGVGPGDALWDWIGGPRGASDTVTNDSLWVRLVDLPQALQARGYAADCDVVLDVSDEPAPWNAGRWRLAITAGEATVTRSDAEPDLRLPVSALGAAYLGGGNLVTLQHAGLVEEQTAGAVRRLWRALRTDVPPTGAIGF